ncbi:chemotaxis-specific protein-glutamate methyltransferase CheB [Myxococcota bacterium]|nr:chemotaxis-specific protein-glutamate methyltransferase CheB [Myxococcota bacterium]MBU1379473.1 chemotaxis-specific protein-glutamate methyltransferase CheB [Myxococcota bacterium]MBU1496176.1 chemotaxis-specific protein-glutamate methyltransferase CheB [Myxococcota bacterium]
MAPINILIVDDSVVYRKILKEVVDTVDNTSVVATVSNGDLALKRLAVANVDMVLCDVEMPVMGGIETLKAIQDSYPDKGVVMVSSPQKHNAGIVLEALELGALDFIVKPDSDNVQENKDYLKEQITRVISVFTSRQVKSTRPAKSTPPSTVGGTARTAPRESAPVSRTPIRTALRNPTGVISTPMSREIPRPVVKNNPIKIDVVVIGVSTGGPNALAEVVPRFSGDLPVPILLVQHMPPLFTASLADSLNKKSSLTVVEGIEGTEVKPGFIYIAPGGKHMTVSVPDGDGRRFLRMNMDPPENSCRPSVDVLFRSAATSYRNNILSVVMTGMGADGRDGVAFIRNTGSCWVITQSAETCTVYGMPAAVDNAGLSSEQVPLNQLANRIETIIRLPRILSK